MFDTVGRGPHEDRGAYMSSSTKCQEKAGNVLELMESSVAFRVSYLVAMTVKGCDLGGYLRRQSLCLCLCLWRSLGTLLSNSQLIEHNLVSINKWGDCWRERQCKGGHNWVLDEDAVEVARGKRGAQGRAVKWWGEDSKGGEWVWCGPCVFVKKCLITEIRDFISLSLRAGKMW